jgi:cell division septum initiation protein DivIVA
MRMPEPVAPPSDGVFTVGRRGYDPHQVDAHLRRMDAEIRILVADRDAAVDQAAQLGRDLDEARLRADRLRTQVRTMAARPSDVQGMSERMRTMLRLAEDEVADMLRRADEEVARRIGEAERSVGQITEGARREAADILRRARADAETTLAGAAKHRAEAEAAAAADRESIAAERAAAEQAIALATARAEHERTSAWAESERRRATVEEDFSIAMDQRRAEALTAIQAERVRTGQWVQHSKDEATRHARAEIAAAEETARRMIAEAQAKVAELADLRGRIAAQLRGTQAQLGTALDDLAPQAPTDAPAAPAVRAAPPAHPVEAPAAPAVVAAPGPAAVAPAPELPALPAASGSTEHSDVPVDASTPEPVTRPLPAVRSGTLVLDAAAPDDSPPDVPGPRTGDDATANGSSAVEADEGAETVPERSESGEARRPTQRRRKRQNSGTRR